MYYQTLAAKYAGSAWCADYAREAGRAVENRSAYFKWSWRLRFGTSEPEAWA